MTGNALNFITIKLLIFFHFFSEVISPRRFYRFGETVFMRETISFGMSIVSDKNCFCVFLYT